MSDDRYIEDVFGPQDGYYRHALVRASRHCDRILAVGEYVAKELRFLGPEFADADIDVVHNGIPAERITLEEKRESQERMKDYAEALLGDRPDYVFTHVARMVLSKAMWRDQRILEQLEPAFREQGRSAVLFVLSTEVPARPPKDIRDMEQWWHWPVAHREGDPDLSGGEALFYQGVQEFNARSHQIKIVYVNQFGWERAVCGERMPADMSFRDIRCGSDAEFGLSMYEPFGIAQLEPLTYGGICVLSRVCGAAGFVDYVTDGDPPDNVIIADYCDLGPVAWSEDRLLSLSRTERDRHELPVARQVAARLLKALPADDHATAALLERGYGLARRMSWDVISRDAVLPAIEAVCRKYQRIRVA
jgi:hypothetical protein